MTVLFGKLVNQFVQFQMIVTRIQAGDPSAESELPAAAAGFRHQAGLLGTYLVIIGMFPSYQYLCDSHIN